MKKIILTIIISFTGLFSISFGYFEDKYFCTINDSSVSVSINQDNGSTRCMEMLQTLNKNIYDADDAIHKADEYIRLNEDKDYRTDVKKDIIKKQSDLKLIKQQVQFSMTEFETNLFVKIKTLISFYFQSERLSLNVRYNNIKTRMNDAKTLNNIQSFQEAKSTLDSVIIRKNLVDDIMRSTDFDNMIPLIVYWIKFYKK